MRMLHLMNWAPATWATENASSQAFLSMLTPTFIFVCSTTCFVTAVMAATVYGGRCSLNRGVSPTFSTMQASRLARSSLSASVRANSMSCFMDILLFGAPGSGGMWIMPMMGFSGKRCEKSNGAGSAGFVIGFVSEFWRWASG